MPNRAELYVDGCPPAIPSEHVLDFLTERAGASVVDLGCGYGEYVRRLRETGREVVGIELDASTVARAQSDGLDVRVGDVTALPFPDGAFDTSVLVEVIEHVADPERALVEALRVARRNVLVTVPNVAEYEHLRAYGVTYRHLVTTDHVNFFTPEELQSLAARIDAHADVRLAEPFEACALVPERGFWWYCLALLERTPLLRPVAWAQIYAEFTHLDR
jgi:methionine biosynthesis protein MetW